MAMQKAVAGSPQRMSLPLENGGIVSSGGPRVALKPKQITARTPAPGMGRGVVNQPGAAPAGQPRDDAYIAAARGQVGGPAGAARNVISAMPPGVSGNPELMTAVQQLTSNPTFQSQVMSGGDPTDAARAATPGAPDMPTGAPPPTVQGRPINDDGTITGANGGIQQLGDAARRRAGMPAGPGGVVAPKPAIAEEMPVDDMRQYATAGRGPEVQAAIEQFSPQAAGFGPAVGNGGFNVFQSGGVRDRIRSLVGTPPMRKAVAGSPMPAPPPGAVAGTRPPTRSAVR